MGFNFACSNQIPTWQIPLTCPFGGLEGLEILVLNFCLKGSQIFKVPQISLGTAPCYIMRRLRISKTSAWFWIFCWSGKEGGAKRPNSKGKKLKKLFPQRYLLKRPQKHPKSNAIKHKHLYTNMARGWALGGFLVWYTAFCFNIVLPQYRAIPENTNLCNMSEKKKLYIFGGGMVFC